MSPDAERWAEAFAIDRQHGSMAPAIIEERIRTLGMSGDEAGVRRWQQIAARYDQLQGGTMQ